MGICREVFLLDEFDWEYIENSKTIIIDKVQEIIPHAKLKGSMYGCLIFDIDKSSYDKLHDLCDVMYIREDNNLLKIVETKG